ncbi:hypothetical protein BDQ17DRAFT_1409619 [Cyathus striatus]|nr:hypothetical protein BDQ17DRAFT_1409619 [Cyathus striatus]
MANNPLADSIALFSQPFLTRMRISNFNAFEQSKISGDAAHFGRGSVPPSEAVKAPPANGLPIDAPSDEETEPLKIARPFLANGSIKLFDIGKREAGEEERSDEEGWRNWVTEDVTGYFVQEELYLPTSSFDSPIGSGQRCALHYMINHVWLTEGVAGYIVQEELYLPKASSTASAYDPAISPTEVYFLSRRPLTTRYVAHEGQMEEESRNVWEELYLLKLYLPTTISLYNLIPSQAGTSMCIFTLPVPRENSGKRTYSSRAGSYMSPERVAIPSKQKQDTAGITWN